MGNELGIRPKIEMSFCMSRLNLRFGIILSAAFLLVVGAGVAAVEHFSGDSDYPYMEVTPGAHVPKLTLHKTIHLNGSVRGIRDIRFSPNNRYVAILYSSELGYVVTIWDLQVDKEQTSFICAKSGGHEGVVQLCVAPGINRWPLILWSKDSKTISFLNGARWDALTGQELLADPINGYDGRLNQDGSKMLTVLESPINPIYIEVYNTTDWSSKKLSLGGLHIVSAIWTSKDKILVGVHATQQNIGQTIDGFTFTNYGDAGFLLIDPEGNEPSKSVWFRGVPAGAPYTGQYVQTNSGLTYENSFITSQIALDPPNIIDDRTLVIRSYYSDAEFSNLKFHPGTGGMAFSPDGKYLFLKNLGWFDGREPVTNVIIDAVNFKEVAKFGGERGTGYGGIAVSPDGKMLALGHVDSVQILNMQNQPQ